MERTTELEAVRLEAAAAKASATEALQASHADQAALRAELARSAEALRAS